MSTRRSRAPRARKARSSEAPPQLEGARDMSVSAVHAIARDTATPSPTETAQLRALEAGWDELLT
jgi:hypothetical protein